MIEQKATLLTKLARWRLSVEITLWRHGLLWPLLLLFVALTIGVWLGWVQPQKRLLVELNQRVVEQKQKWPKVQPLATVLDDQAHQWEKIRQTWPPAQQVDTNIANVIHTAQNLGLVVEQGDYLYLVEPELMALKVTMNLPLSGSYISLRRWVTEVLRDHPNLALEELAIEREVVSSAKIEVKARWVGLYRIDNNQVNNLQTTAKGLLQVEPYGFFPASNEARQ